MKKEGSKGKDLPLGAKVLRSWSFSVTFIVKQAMLIQAMMCILRMIHFTVTICKHKK